jgi:hypothetical protein
LARTDWIALVTRPAAEYTASVELSRFGLAPYLPQRKRLHLPVRAATPMLRSYPLFPRYLFLPLRELDHSVLRNCHALLPSPVLADSFGRHWRAPDTVIRTLQTTEVDGVFDEKTLKTGDKVRINGVLFADLTAFVENTGNRDLLILTPLLGGASVRISRKNVTRLTDS